TWSQSRCSSGDLLVLVGQGQAEGGQLGAGDVVQERGQAGVLVILTGAVLGEVAANGVQDAGTLGMVAGVGRGGHGRKIIRQVIDDRQGAAGVPQDQAVLGGRDGQAEPADVLPFSGGFLAHAAAGPQGLDV